jgi:hypothetical protein
MDIIRLKAKLNAGFFMGGNVINKKRFFFIIDSQCFTTNSKNNTLETLGIKNVSIVLHPNFKDDNGNKR